MRALKLFRRAFPVAALLACLLSPAAADATWPGKPGRIAYWALDGVHTIRPDGTGDRVILPYLTGNVFAWSPNGREIAYSGDTVWRARADGAHRHLIADRGYGPLSDDTVVSSPAWGPRGDRLVFTVSFVTDTGDPPSYLNRIYSVRRDGSHVRELVRGREAVWSRSGAHIRFIDEDYDIVEIKPNGRGRRELAHYDRDTRSLDLSPDGNRLVYETGPENEPTIRTLNVRNGARTKLTLGKPGVAVGAVVWAPGGKRLAYIFRPGRERYQLRTVRPNGHGDRNDMTFPESEWVYDLAWQTR
jgi:Tol biopolymer transport system component